MRSSTTPTAFASRIVAALMLLACLAWATPEASQAATSIQRGPFISNYRGSDEVIARASDAELTEAQLYYYLLMSDARNPLVLHDYRYAKTAEEQERLERETRRVIQAWATIRAMAAEVDGGQYFVTLGAIRQRLFEHPIHELVWIDNFLRPSIEVLDADVRKYFDEHPEIAEGIQPLQARYILLKVDSPLPRNILESASKNPDGQPWDADLPADWRQARSKMYDILIEMQTSDLTFPEAARQYSDAPNADRGGLTPPFTKGTYFPEFEQRAAALDQGNVSRVFLGPDGVYLLQGVEAPPAKRVTLEEAAPDIRKQLYFEQLRQRYVHELQQLRQKTVTVNRASLIDGLDPRAQVVMVNDFDLNRDEVWTLFPEFVTEDFQLQKGYLNDQVTRLINGELIAAYNEHRRWLQTPQLLWASKMAADIMKADYKLREICKTRLKMTREDVLQYMKDHPKVFERVTRPRFSLVQVRLVDPDSMSAERREYALGRMRPAMEEAVETYQGVRLERIATDWPVKQADPTSLLPKLVEIRLCKAADKSVRVLRWSSEMPVTDLPEDARARAQEIEDQLPQLIERDARFLPIEQSESALTLFYVEQPNYTLPSILQLMHMTLYQTAAQEIRADIIDEYRQRLLDAGDLEITLPEPGSGAPEQ